MIEWDKLEVLRLMRAEVDGGFVFRVRTSDLPDARILVRFTDDAGLHWQIDHNLHLQKLDRRDW